MATENFIVNTLPDFVQTNRELMNDILNDIAIGSPTIRRAYKQTGIKKSAYLNYLDVNPEIQDGNDCGFDPQGTIELTQREVNVAVLKVNMEVCPKKLRGKYAEYLVRTRAGEQPLPFEEEIIREIARFIQDKLEIAVWQGDTASGDNDLKHFDGFLKLAETEEDVIDVNAGGAATMSAAIRQIIAAIPTAVRKRGARIFLSPEAFEKYVMELVDANLYHYDGPHDQDPEEWVIPGTRVRVVSTPGLSGTSKALATWDRNLVYGTDLENDDEYFNITFDNRSETFLIKVSWASGAQFAFPDLVVLATLPSVETLAAAASAPVMPTPASDAVFAELESAERAVETYKGENEQLKEQVAELNKQLEAAKASADAEKTTTASK